MYTMMDEWEEKMLMYGVIGVASAAGVVGLYFAYRRLFPVGAVQFQGRRWSFHDDDKIWMGRMILGECGEDAIGGDAVLWSVASRWVTKPVFQDKTFTQVIRAFSQPVNPLWADPNSGRCLERPAACSDAAIRRRQAITNTSWAALPSNIRQLVQDFVGGRTRNPISGYNNFAAAGSSSFTNTELTPVTVGGNTFIRDPGSLSGEVRIV